MFIRYILAFFIVLLAASAGLAAPFKITESEQAWLDAHPGITVGLVKDNPPQSMLGKDGVPEGSDAEMVKLLSERLSGHIEIVTGSWQKLYNDAKEKRIDVLMSVTPTEERRTYFNYTRPYMSSPHIIVGKEDGPHFGSLISLENHTVALERGIFLNSFIREHYPAIRIKEFGNALEALRAIQRGEAEAYVGGKHVVEYLLSTYGIADLDIHGQSNSTSETNVIAVRKDWPELASLLDRTLASIPQNEIHKLMENWVEAGITSVASPLIKLTDEEKIWLQSHPNIVVGAETDWPPYDFVANGKAVGFANDYLRLLAEKTGLNIQFVHGFTWEQLLAKAEKKEIDILPCLSETDERKQFFNFTSSYNSNPFSLIVNQKMVGINSLADLSGKTLARVRGYAFNKLIVEKYPEIKIVYVKSPLDGLVAVSEGRIDGFMDYLAVVNYLRREYLIPDLRVANTDAFPDEIVKDHIGVRKDWPILNTILEKAMASVTYEEYEDLKQRWFVSGQSDGSGFYLTPTEEEWLKTLGSLRVGITTAWVPINFVGDGGDSQGIASEYIEIIRDKLGLDLEVISSPWNELQEQARAGAIDILHTVNETEIRRKFLTFAKPHLRIPIIIGTQTDAPYYPHINDLKGVTVGVGEGFAVQEKINRDYPEITTTRYKTIKEALFALEAGEISALVTNSVVFSYFQKELDLMTSIRINNMSPYEDVLAFGVRHELAPLVPLINRVLAGISPAEHELIMDKGANLPTLRHTDWRMVWCVFGGIALLFLIVLFWGFKMSQEVKRRRKAEADLAKSDKQFDSIFSRVSDHVTVFDTHYRYIYANQSMLDYMGLDKDDLYGKKLGEVVPQARGLTEIIYLRLKETLADGTSHLHSEQTTLNGRNIICEMIMVPLFTDSGDIYAVSLIYRDITQQKNDAAELERYARTQAVLLKEVNHRVKNNLTAIISMLHMEGDKSHAHDGLLSCRAPLKAVERRISSLLVVHSMLSGSEWQPLLLSDICEKVISKSLRGYLGNREFCLNSVKSDIFLDSDRAHSMALVFSELAINSAKYAQRAGSKLIVSVSAVKNDDSIELTYGDNGPGYPEQGDSCDSADDGIGMEIIEGVVTGNLGGHLRQFNDGGACTRITFPVGDGNSEIVEDA